MTKERKQKRGFIRGFVCLFLFIVCIFAGLKTFSYQDTLKFVQISDVHLSDKTVNTTYKVLADSKTLFKDELSQINAIPNLDFVIVTGDMTDKPKETLIKEFIAGMNTLKAPWYSSFGNHDVVFGSDITREKYVKILRQNNKNYKFDKSYYSFSPKKGYRVIVLDCINDKKITANGKIPKEQLTWLDGELSKAQKNNEVPMMFLHCPLYEPFSSFHHKMTNPDEIYAVLKKHKTPMAIFSGHYHATKIYKEGNILHVSTPSLVSYPNAFRVVSVTNLPNKVVFKFEFRETGLKEIQKKAKLLVFSSKIYYGEETDRQGTYILDK